MWLARKRHRTNLRPSVPRAERKWLLPESSRSCSVASSKISHSRAKRADSPRASGSREVDSSCAPLHTALFHGLCLISGLWCNTTFSKELCTSSFPLYSMNPNLRNLFMKKLTRDRVVPIISASIS